MPFSLKFYIGNSNAEKYRNALPPGKTMEKEVYPPDDCLNHERAMNETRMYLTTTPSNSNTAKSRLPVLAAPIQTTTTTTTIKPKRETKERKSPKYHTLHYSSYYPLSPPLSRL